MTTALGVTELEVQCDSLLIVSQVDGDYTTKDDRMVAYLNVVIAWKTKFSRCDFKQVPRSKNNHADSLAALTSVVNFQFRCEITIEHIPKPSIKKPDEEILRIYRSPGWKDPIISFLKKWDASRRQGRSSKLQHIATRYVLLGELLHKESYSNDPYLRCLGAGGSQECDARIYDGDCGNHAEGRSRAHKAINKKVLLTQEVRWR